MSESEMKCEFVECQMESFKRHGSAIITRNKRLGPLSLEAPPGDFKLLKHFISTSQAAEFAAGTSILLLLERLHWRINKKNPMV